jgi:hypothetical protein
MHVGGDDAPVVWELLRVASAVRSELSPLSGGFAGSS